MDLIICNEKPGGGESVQNYLRKISGLSVQRGFTSVDQILEVARSQIFDLCVIGARSLNWWKKISPQLRAVQSNLGHPVVMAHVLTPEYLLKSYWLVIKDVLYSSLPNEELVRRCMEVRAGTRDMSADASVVNLGSFLPEPGVFRIVRDEWDVQILMLLVDGRTNEEISETIHMTTKTVRNRISRLIRDAGVQNRTQLVILMVR